MLVRARPSRRAAPRRLLLGTAATALAAAVVALGVVPAAVEGHGGLLSRFASIAEAVPAPPSPLPAGTMPLPRLGWTATASDSQTTDPPARVLDGDAGTLWHSASSGTGTGLPDVLTIDTKASRALRGLTYLPRQDTSSNGRIGRFTVATSADGTTWRQVATGTWADTKAAKTVTWAAVSGRYVRLTAHTEAGARGPWSTAAEVDLLTNAPSAAVGGRWGPVIKFPIVPTSAVMLRNNKVLTWSAYQAESFNMSGTVTRVAVLDLATGTVSTPSTVDTDHQMFCTGITLLADGKVLVNGGSTDEATTIYDPEAGTWTKGPPMVIPRAYQGNTLLSTGEVFTIGGSWVDKAGGKHGEVWAPGGAAGTGSWRRLTGVPVDPFVTADPARLYRADNHAWLFATSGGRVFHAGPSKRMNWVTTTGDGSVTNAGLRGTSGDMMNGAAVMYDAGRLLVAGGATAYEHRQATNQAFAVDFRGGPTAPVATTRTGDLAYPRSYVNGVAMPDGGVLVVGGQQLPKSFTDTAAARSPELWNPSTGRFTTMAPDSVPRTYHSFALLLPDGRVLSGGGGLCGGCAVNHLDAQIFTPPYLLNADGTLRPRPAITSAPATAAPGSTITVQTSGGTPRFALVRRSAVTHTVNNDQRRIALTPVAVDATTARLTIPDAGTALPGEWMLFALDSRGTPSLGHHLSIG